jgi:hypothetical protein
MPATPGVHPNYRVVRHKQPRTGQKISPASRAVPRPKLFRLACCLLGVAVRTVASTPVAEGPARAANPRLTGTPLMQVWHAEDYDASPINWRVIQHPTSGFVYVGNNFGVLEFDGATWRLIPTPREAAARALAIDRDGVIWAAGNSYICRLAADDTGTLDAVDVTTRLPPGEQVFGLINRALSTVDGMYLSGDRRVFLFRPDGSVRVWRTEGIFSSIWQAGDAVYVSRDRTELLRLQPDGGTKVVFTTDDQDHPLMRTFAAMPTGQQWLLLTRLGPMRWGGEGQPVTPLAPENMALFAADPARVSLRLSDGRIVFGVSRGAVILDADGKLQQRLDVTHGLPVDTINGLGEDREGGLWVAMQNGVARVQLASPFAVHRQSQGLDAGPRRLVRFHDRLYVAHGSGISWRDPMDGRFHNVAGVRGGANRPLIVQGRLLVTTTGGVREIAADDTVTSVTNMNFIPLTESRRNPGWLFGGDGDGLWVFSYPGGATSRPTWKLEGRLKNLPAGIVQIYDAGDGFVWAVSDAGGIWRVDFRRGVSLDAMCEQFDVERGVPAARRRDHVQLFFLGPDLFAASVSWLLHYDPALDHFTPAPADLEIASSADAIENSSPNSVWLHAVQPQSEILHLATRDAGEPWLVDRFAATPLQGMFLNSLFHEPETRTLWVSGQGLLVSMDLDWRANPALPLPPAVVRRVSTGAGAVLYGGAVAQQPRVLALAADQNALRIEFATPTFVGNYLGNIRTLYRSRVDGLEPDWTHWSTEPYRDLTNLPYRELMVHIQAQAPDGRISAESSLAFSISAPWWLTRGALALYGLITCAVIFGFIALRTRALRQRAVELERIVAARTAELAEKNVTLAAQNSELADLRQLETREKIAARLAEEKARLEVLRYQLNPHFLFNAFTSICAQLPPTLAGARATIERLTDFCRLTLFRPAGDENPTLREEMRMLSAYLDIEQTRWGDLLQVRVNVAPDVEGERVPPLLLLPLVENALKYGASTSPNGLQLRIGAWRDDGGLLIEVANTGTWVASPEGAPGVPSLGIGHDNLRQRLQRYYPDAHTFNTTGSDGWVTVRIRLSLGARAPATTLTPC